MGQALSTRCLAHGRGVTSALQMPSEHLQCTAEAPARPTVQSTVPCLPEIHEGQHRKQGGQARGPGAPCAQLWLESTTSPTWPLGASRAKVNLRLLLLLFGRIAVLVSL